MNRLPEEVFLQILDDLKHTGTSLASYASVSLNWQRAIEQINFQSLSVFSLELDIFRSSYRVEHLQILQELTFYPVALIEAHSNTRELVEEVKRQISQHVSSFFETLLQFSNYDISLNCGLSVTIAPPQVFRKADVMFMNARQGCLTSKMVQNIKTGNHSQVLTALDIIPLNLHTYRASIKRTIGLKVFPLSGTEYDTTAIVDMVSACPNLQNCSWTYAEARNSKAREERSMVLVSSLRSLEMPQAETIKFELDSCSTNPYAEAAPNLSSADLDVMRTAWKTFSLFQNLRSLDVHGDFGPQSFELWTWPNLEDCQITFRTFSVDGQRHFLHNTSCHDEQQADEEDGSDANSDRFSSQSDPDQDQATLAFYHHTLPNPATVPAMIESLLAAVSRMPRLRRLIFQNTEISQTCLQSHFSMSYYGIGTAAYVGDDRYEDTLEERVYFDVGSWRPSDAGEQGELITQKLMELGIHHKYLDVFQPGN